MKVTVRVNAQRYENYGFHEGREHWKPKGGTYFTVEDVDSDLAMYTDKSVIKEALIEQLQHWSTDLERYEYIDHEIVFSEMKIAGVDFSDAVSKLMNL